MTDVTEERALELAWMAVERAGGTRAVYRNPRYAFSLQQTTDFEVDGVAVELRHGEISSPAIVTVGGVGGWVFEIHDDDIELLMRPPRRRDGETERREDGETERRRDGEKG